MSKFKAFFNKRKKLPQSNIGLKVLNLFMPKKYVNTNDLNRKETKIIWVLNYALQSSLLVNVILIVALLSLLPLKEKVPYFVHFLPKEEQIVYVERYKKSIKEEKTVKEFMARDYVMKRETIDLASEKQRWEKVMFLSTSEVGKIFEDEYDADKNPNSPYKYAVDHNQIRLINIISSNSFSINQYQVEFEMIDTNKNTGKVISSKDAEAIVTFSPQEDKAFKGEDDLNNPFGWVVSDYSVGIRKQKVGNN